MNNFHKCIQGNPIISCGPTRPPATACCPCTNLLRNPGFDQPSAVGGPAVPEWNSGGMTSLASFPNHSGRYLSNGTLSILSVLIRGGGNINQTVPISEGCCYTLSFAANVRSESRLVASVSFPDAVPSQPCPPLVTPTSNPLVAFNIRHIVVRPPIIATDLFPNYTLVVCTPPGARTACITFQNNSAVENFAFVDNVVFQNTGGPCPSCEQRF